jgi:hypothetical protein
MAQPRGFAAAGPVRFWAGEREARGSLLVRSHALSHTLAPSQGHTLRGALELRFG